MSSQESTGRDVPTFEESLSELEEIVRALDREEMRLDEALDLFREGVDHLRTAARLLDEADVRVEELVEEASGELSAVELEEEADGEAGEGAS